MATALLGEPKVLVLDEPANGLDPEGIAWLRGLLREHAYAGGTVLISSHQLAELAQLIDDVVVIANGRLRHEGPLADLYGMTVGRVRVRGSDPQRLAEALENAGGKVTADEDALTVDGLTAEETGEIAFAAGVPLHELLTDTPNLEQIFLELAAA